MCVDLCVYPLRDLDVILGKAWLSRYHLNLDCAQRTMVSRDRCAEYFGFLLPEVRNLQNFVSSHTWRERNGSTCAVHLGCRTFLMYFRATCLGYHRGESL